MRQMLHRLRGSVIPALFLLTTAMRADVFATAPVSDDYSTWPYSMTISLNAGAYIGADVTNFPILVHLTTSTFPFSQLDGTGNDGREIRFSASNGTDSLPYQIDGTITTSSTSANIWVLVPTVTDASNTTIRMYWGKAGQTAHSNGAKVFLTTGGFDFSGVFHLSESISSAAGNFKDATGTYTATGSSNITTHITAATSLIGTGQTWDGTIQAIQVSSTSIVTPSVGTVSFWGRTPATISASSTTTNNPARVGFGTESGSRFYLGYNTVDAATAKFHSWVGANAFTPTNTIGTSHIDHFAVTWAGTTETGYLNGVSIGTATFTAGINPTIATIGATGNPSNDRYWVGDLDEVRVDKVARSNDWISLCYNNQTPAGDNVCKYYPPRPTLSSPADAATDQSTTLTLSWSASTGATSYRVQVSTSSTFGTTAYDASGISTTSTAVTPALSGGTVYYWRANATNANGTSDYSAIRSFTTIFAIPSPPTNLAVGSINTTGATFTWTASAGATSYNLQVSTASTFATKVVDATGISTTSYATTALSGNTTYYWQASATNGAGTSSWATPSPTTFLSAPAVPTGLSSGSITSNGATLSWYASAGATSYNLQVSTSTTFATKVVDATGISTTSYATTALSGSTTYYWQVDATNSGGTSSWSSSSNFTTSGAGSGSEDFSTWPYSMIISLNAGPYISADVTNFPVLVHLTTSNFPFSQLDATGNDGRDIRFSKSNGTDSLAYQIDGTITTSSTTANIWVFVPTVLDASNTTIKMFWGKSGQTAHSDGSKVFTTGAGFSGVYHLSESISSASGNFKDACGNYNATGSSNITTHLSTSTTLIGTGQTWDGTIQSIDPSSTSIVTPSIGTISFWAKTPATISATTTATNNPARTGFGTEINSRFYLGYSTVSASQGYFDCWMGAVNYNPTTTVGPSAIYYFTATWAGGNETGYLNGSSIGTVASAAGGNPAAVHIGASGNPTNDRYWIGDLDEVRVDNTNRSTDWISLCYNNQNPAGDNVCKYYPTRPTLSTPTNGATGQSTTPTLTWAASIGATSYRVQVSTSSTFGTTAYDQSGISTTSQVVSPALSSTVYYWHVSATNANGTSSYSSAWSFVVGVPTNQAPTDITLSSSTLAEGQASGTTVGTLSTTDAESGAETYTYTLVSGTGSTDNASFQITGSTLKTNAVLSYCTSHTYSIRVKTDDGTTYSPNNLTYEKVFTITVTRANRAAGMSTTTSYVEGGMIGAQAVDGSVATRWSSYNPAAARDSDWIYIDLGAAYYVDSVLLKWETAGGLHYKIQGTNSTDAAARGTDQPWTTVAEITNGTSGETRAINCTSTYERYVRMRGITRTTIYGYSLWEFEVYGCANTAPTNISLSNSSIDENAGANATVGTLSCTDAENGTTGTTYALVTGTGDADNSLFNIYTNTTLRATSSLDYETATTRSIRVQITDEGGLTYAKALTITVNNKNDAPMDIALSATTVDEQLAVGTVVGTFSSTDADAGESFAYTLVAGTGATDNDSFTISSNQLKTAKVLLYSGKNPLSIRVQTDDGTTLTPNNQTYSKAFTITINMINVAPTDISLSNSSMYAGKPSGTRVATIFSTDANLPGDNHTYTLVSGTGSDDNASFTIAGNSLYSAASFSAGTKSIRIRTTDQGSLYTEKAFTITITTCSGTCTDDYSMWPYSKKIMLNTTRTGANVTTDTMNFPVLLRINPGNFSWFSQTRPGGTDVRFAKTDGTHIPYQIERWRDGSSNNDTAEIWVKIDTVYGNNNLQTFKMYWGKSDAADSSNSSAVFSTANGFLGVYHLGNYDNGTYASATGANNGTATNLTGSSDASAVVGRGTNFVAASSQYITTNDASFDLTDNFTLSTWIYTADATDNWARVIDKIDRWNLGYGLGGKAGTYGFIAYWTGGWGGDPAATLEPLSDNTWTHVTATVSGGVARTYRNGTLIATYSTHATEAITQTATSLTFGKSSNQAAYWTGSLDEIRIENTPRSATWIKLCYENQKANQTLVDMDDYAEWSTYRNVTLNTSPAGANVAGNNLDFPVLVRLNANDFDFTNAQDTGQDIRFAKSNGAHLAYQIERWDRGNQLAELWVRVDTVYGNNGGQYFTMYWGKTPVDSRSNGNIVFDTANGFVAVYHLNEGSTAANGTFTDATANATVATEKATTSTQTSNTIGYGQNPGANAVQGSQGIQIPGSVITVGSGTISVWGYGLPANGSYFFGSVSGIVPRYNVYMGSATNVYSRLGSTETFSSTLAPASGTNHLYTLTWSSTTAGNFYCDTASGGALGSTTALTQPTYILLSAVSNQDNCSGNIPFDEFRIEKVTRNSDWIKLCYQNQRPDQVLVDSLLDDYSKWAFSKKITIDGTAAGISGKVARFPYLVRLTGSNFDFNQAQSSGQDIRFSRADGARFQYEVERWDKTNQVADIWVLVDTVYTNSTQYIKMYWGKSDATSKSNGPKVFETTNGFVGVYHLGEGGTGARYNSAQNQYNGTTVGYDGTESTSGAIGKGDSLKVTGDGISLGTGISPTAGITLSCWAKPHTWPTTYGKFICQQYAAGTNAAPYHTYSLEYSATAAPTVGAAATGVWQGSTTTSTTTADQWTYVAGTYDLSYFRSYFNGSPENPLNYAGTMATSGEITTIGYNSYTTERLNAVVDEVRIENQVRSADWIKLCYYNQVPTSTISTCDSADAFRPLAVKRYYTGSTLDSIYVGNHNASSTSTRWAIKFASNKGGGIKFLAADSLSATSNQLDSNLFSVIYNTQRSDTGAGTLTLLDSSVVFTRIRQQKTMSSQPFTIDYTVLGNGKLYARVTTYAASALSGGLEFKVLNNATTAYRNYQSDAAASDCRWMLHADSGSGKFDLLMSIFNTWSQADGTNKTSKAAGIKSTTWSLRAGSRQTWEYMVDFSHKNLHDSLQAHYYSRDYRNPDSLSFYTGTPLLERAWEDKMYGHWKFDEGAGDTAGDASSAGNAARLRTYHWTTGKWGGGDSCSGTDSVMVAPNASFNANGFTILGWIKPAAPMTTSSTVLKKYSSTGSGYKLTGDAGGQLLFSINNGGTAVDLHGKTVLSPGTWYHVGAELTVYMDTMKLYVNGVVDSMRIGSFSGNLASNTDSLVMGKGFNGVLDDMRFYGEYLRDRDVKAIFLKGYGPDRGMYMTRADNNNTTHCILHGQYYTRYLPAFSIANYWSSSQPSASTPKVYVDGTLMTYNSDYYASLDAGVKTLTIGFNKSFSTNPTIYIDDDQAIGVTLTSTMPKMYWATTTVGSVNHVWVKNFSGNYFGSATAKNFFFDWKMNYGAPSSSNKTKNGEIWFYASSLTNPNTRLDTTVNTNCITGIDGDHFEGFGNMNMVIGSYWPISSKDVNAAYTYSIAESSGVRVLLNVNTRTVSSGGQSYNIDTRWAVYPTGQVWRWDSLSSKSGNFVKVYYDFMLDSMSVPTITIPQPKSRLRGGLISSTVPDFVVAVLPLKNSANTATPGIYAQPFDKDTIRSVALSDRVGLEFYDETTNPDTKWGTLPTEAAAYMDIQRDPVTTGYIDSVGCSVQHFPNPALTMTSGTLNKHTWGDIDTNGFSEGEGAYVIGAANNTAQFTLLASGTDSSCRVNPAFRITGYYAATEPQYVYVGGVLKTKDYGYNVYLNKPSKELVLQFNQTICSNTDIYISYDRTLAVTMAGFLALAGDRVDTLSWKTESEEQNLGFFLYRRINPTFYDSLVKRAGTLGDSAQDNGVLCLSKRLIQPADTAQWQRVNEQIIRGAAQGVSYGPISYKLVDYQVFNDVLYEYRLEAVDYHNNREAYKKYAQAMPRRVLPLVFDLMGNFPNPFKKMTLIRFALPVKTRVDLFVYNLQGRLVKRLVNSRKMEPDFYKILWDGTDELGRTVASGPYIYRLNTPGFVKARMMILAR